VEKKEFDERVLRLQDVGNIIDKLPAEIRSEAFGLLKGYVSGRNQSDSDDAGNEDELGEGSGGDVSLFGRFDHDKPSDNVRLIAAYLFQQYGAEPFSVDEMKEIASDAGITVPARIDMTLRQAQENGKYLFVNAGTGRFKPTVHGETHLKDAYGVKKGNMKRKEAAK
jgi:hypothetical protein